MFTEFSIHDDNAETKFDSKADFEELREKDTKVHVIDAQRGARNDSIRGVHQVPPQHFGHSEK